ncbi:hypothetical protein BFP97_08980 [Roseivirga sp. 4D4]|uniref:glycosyltransferase family 2 protein n=1 Tax=Roseivirga sp. 4D4 TaxID=1889784 RepID=UPI0008531638|nr:glycosyltransferase [Roseivirga sp. 4D4]OEK01638.1 hypothetical protein BFP97_08980 [Roseivirga sp. 4D4]
MYTTESIVSIVTPLFNRVEDVSLTIESVRQQTYENWEWVIVDDGSTDGSLELLNDWSIRDSRIIIEKRNREPKGASTCRNIGVGKAKGDFLMFLDSDDLLAPQCLQNRLRLIEDEDFIVTQTGIIRKEHKLVKKYWSSLLHMDDTEAFMRLEGWCISSTFFLAKFAKQYAFDETAASLQDWDYHLRILQDSPKYVKYANSDPDVYIRSGHGDRISLKNGSSKRVMNRFTTFLKIEELLSQVGKGASIKYLDKHYLKHLKESVLYHSYDDFRLLYEYWKKSSTYYGKTGRQIKIYLILQFWLRRLGLSFLSGLAYRTAKFICPKRLFNPNERELILTSPILLEKEIQDILYK